MHHNSERVLVQEGPTEPFVVSRQNRLARVAQSGIRLDQVLLHLLPFPTHLGLTNLTRYRRGKPPST